MWKCLEWMDTHWQLKLKNNSEMKDIYLVLHTSLSGVFNTNMVEKVGANKFLAKFEPDALVKTIQDQLKVIHQ